MKHTKLGDAHKQQGKISKSGRCHGCGSVQAHTQQGQGGQKGCSAKAHTAASQASWAHGEPLLQTEESSGFPSASLGTGRSRYMWRENTHHSQSSERSESCAAAALQVLPAPAIALGQEIIQFQLASWLLLHPSFLCKWKQGNWDSYNESLTVFAFVHTSGKYRLSCFLRMGWGESCIQGTAAQLLTGMTRK